MIHYLLLVSSRGELYFSYNFKSRKHNNFDADVAQCLTDIQFDGINFIEDGDRTIVYRSFGPCLAITSVDSSDNLLQCYEFLNLYIYTLNQYFPSLSYHIILQNPYKLQVVLEEMVIGGQIIETSTLNALGYLKLLDNVQS